MRSRARSRRSRRGRRRSQDRREAANAPASSLGVGGRRHLRGDRADRADGGRPAAVSPVPARDRVFGVAALAGRAAVGLGAVRGIGPVRDRVDVLAVAAGRAVRVVGGVLAVGPVDGDRECRGSRCGRDRRGKEQDRQQRAVQSPPPGLHRSGGKWRRTHQSGRRRPALFGGTMRIPANRRNRRDGSTRLVPRFGRSAAGSACGERAATPAAPEGAATAGAADADGHVAPSPSTVGANAAVAKTLPLADPQDFEDAQRGLVASDRTSS